MASSRQWATYVFGAYRAGLEASEIVPDEVHASPKSLCREVSAVLDLPLACASEPWALGLSAVIEATDGSLTYWALSHPLDKPDFHHPDSFTLVLPAPEAP